MNIEITKSPIFIIGSPRSGTTALGKSLGEHKNLWCSEENYFIPQIFLHGYKLGGFRDSYTYTSSMNVSWFSHNKVTWEELLYNFGLGINNIYTSRSKGKRWVEQNPIHSLILDSVIKLYPEAKFLHIVRNGRDVVESVLNSGWSHSVAKIFSEACNMWKEYLEAVLKFENSCLKNVLTVYYNSLSKDPEKEFTRIFNFLHEGYDFRVVDFYRKRRLRSSFSNKPRSSWKRWSKGERQLFESTCGALMQKFNLNCSWE